MAPGLAAPFPALAEDVFPAAPALSRWLARAAALPFAGLEMEQAALALFDLDPPGDSTPLAPFMYFADTGRAPSGCWWCLEPAHLRADMRGLILFDAQSCRLADQERQVLFTTLSDFLSNSGCKLVSGAAGRWYLQGPDCNGLHSTPLSRVRGKPVGDYLPRGSAAPAWMQLSNEMQMLLHSHPVNQTRVGKGLAALNSVWIWGGGVLPDSGGKLFEGVYSDDPLLRGLALWAGSSVQRPPAGARQLLRQGCCHGRILVMPDGELMRAAAYERVSEWSEAVARYEHDWFVPLLQALAGGRLQRLELIAMNGRRYSLGRGNLWRFWRRAADWRSTLAF